MSWHQWQPVFNIYIGQFVMFLVSLFSTDLIADWSHWLISYTWRLPCCWDQSCVSDVYSPIQPRLSLAMVHCTCFTCHQLCELHLSSVIWCDRMVWYVTQQWNPRLLSSLKFANTSSFDWRHVVEWTSSAYNDDHWSATSSCSWGFLIMCSCWHSTSTTLQIN